MPFDEKPSNYVNDLFEDSSNNADTIIPIKTTQMVMAFDDQAIQPIAHRTRHQLQRMQQERDQQIELLNQQQAESQQALEEEQTQAQVSQQEYSLVVEYSQTTNEQEVCSRNTQVSLGTNANTIIQEPQRILDDQTHPQYTQAHQQFNAIQVNLSQQVFINSDQFWQENIAKLSQDFKIRTEQSFTNIKDRLEYGINALQYFHTESIRSFSELAIMIQTSQQGTQENKVRVDYLYEACKKLEELINGYQQAIIDKDNELRTQLNNHYRSQQLINITYAQQQRKVQDHSAIVQSHDRQLSIINETLVSYADFIAEQISQIDTIRPSNQQLDQVSNDQARLNTTQQNLHIQCEALSNDVSSILYQVRSLDLKVRDLSNQRSTNQNQITQGEELDQFRQEICRDLNQLTQKVDYVQDQIDEDKAEVDNQQMVIDTINDKFEEFSIAQNDKEQSLIERNTQLEGDVQALKQQLDQVSNERTQEKLNIDTLTSKFNQLEIKLTQDFDRKYKMLEDNLKQQATKNKINIVEATKTYQDFQKYTSQKQQNERQFINDNYMSNQKKFTHLQQRQQRQFKPYKVPKLNPIKLEDAIFQKPKDISQGVPLWHETIQHPMQGNAPNIQIKQEEPNDPRNIETFYQQISMMEMDPIEETYEDKSDYANFRFKEEFDGNLDKAMIWLDRFFTEVNKYRLTEEQVFAQIKYLFKQAAMQWFQEYNNSHGFASVRDFITQFQKQYQVDQLKLYTRFHQTTRKREEPPQAYLNRLRSIALPAQISTQMLKQKFLLEIQQDFPNLDPFTIKRIQNDKDISTQDILDILNDFKDSQRFQKQITSTHSPSRKTSSYSKSFGGGRGDKTKSKDDKDNKDKQDKDASRGNKDRKRNINKRKLNRAHMLLEMVNELYDKLDIVDKENDQDDEDGEKDNDHSKESSAPKLSDHESSDSEGFIDHYKGNDQGTSKEDALKDTLGMMEAHNTEDVCEDRIEYYLPEGNDICQDVFTMTPTTNIGQSLMYPQTMDRQRLMDDFKQCQIEEEIINLEMNVQKAERQRDNKLQQYERKYGKPAPQQGQDGRNKFGNRLQQFRPPMWTINAELVHNSPKHFLILAKQVVGILDRPKNLLRTEVAMAQANKWIDTLERAYQKLNEGAIQTNATNVINSLTISNTLGGNRLPTNFDAKNNYPLYREAYKVEDSNDSPSIEIVKAPESMPLLYMKCRIKGMYTFAMIDSGATLSAISMRLVENLDLKSQVVDINQNIIVMDNRKVSISKLCKDCIVQIDDSFAVRINLIVSEKSTWPMLLGRNFLESIKAGLTSRSLFYMPPSAKVHRKVNLFSQRYRSIS